MAPRFVHIVGGWPREGRARAEKNNGDLRQEMRLSEPSPMICAFDSRPSPHSPHARRGLVALDLDGCNAGPPQGNHAPASPPMAVEVHVLHAVGALGRGCRSAGVAISLDRVAAVHGNVRRWVC